MTRILFEIEIRRGKFLPPITVMRLANSEEDIQREFEGQAVKITAVRTIRTGKAEVKK